MRRPSYLLPQRRLRSCPGSQSFWNSEKPATLSEREVSSTHSSRVSGSSSGRKGDCQKLTTKVRVSDSGGFDLGNLAALDKDWPMVAI